MAAIVLTFGCTSTRAVTPESDHEIRHNVEMLLEGSSTLGMLPLEVSVEGGVATIGGRVRLLSESWAAEDVVASARGVMGIENRIAIDAGSRSADEVAGAIRRRFEDRVALSSGSVTVQVTEGKAVLSGSVKDARVRFEARDACAETPGVVGVEDRIESPSAPDDEILKALQRVLGPRSLTGVRGDIRPTVKDGDVVLEGLVPTLANRRAAERTALGVNGVRRVENKLEVVKRRPPGELR